MNTLQDPPKKPNPALNFKKNKVKPELPPETEFTEDELCAELCRKSFYAFVKEFWDVVVQKKPVWNWHIEFLCQEFQKIAERVFDELPLEADTTVNISPGSTKSTIISVMLPAWIWTRMPHARIISASYAFDIAEESSSKSRDLIKSEKYKRLFPGIDIRTEHDAKAHYVNTKGGERYAFGVGGAVTGKHAHFIIVDDPLNAEQAASDAELKKVNRWMEQTLPSRKVDQEVTPTILIMQRLHENDPTGVRLEKEVEEKLPHYHICLPAELTDSVRPEFCRDYYIDGLMDPVRLSAKVLKRQEKTLGGYAYAGQYLQTPIPEGTAMFHVHKLKVEDPPRFYKRMCRFWDKAGTLDGGAYTVGTLMAVDDDDLYWVVDVIRVRLDSGRRETLIAKTAKNDGYHVVVGVEEEPGSGGKHSSVATVKNLKGYRVKVIKVGKSDGDKAARADPYSVMVNNDQVRLVKGEWNREYLNELRYFPNSRYKDMVDASAGAFNVLSNKRRQLGGGGILLKNRR